MRLFHRRDEPPAEIVAQLPRDERVVSWADVRGGGTILASPAGLWWPDGDSARLIGWQHITKATWHDGVLRVIEAEVLDDLLLVDRDPVSAELEVPRDLPPVVRKRVQANIVQSDLLTIGDVTARFVSRRIPGRDGVQWWARIESDTPDSEHARAVVSARLAILRAAQVVRD
jgi:hypothetical protein